MQAQTHCPASSPQNRAAGNDGVSRRPRVALPLLQAPNFQFSSSSPPAPQVTATSVGSSKSRRTKITSPRPPTLLSHHRGHRGGLKSRSCREEIARWEKRTGDGVRRFLNLRDRGRGDEGGVLHGGDRGPGDLRALHSSGRRGGSAQRRNASCPCLVPSLWALDSRRPSPLTLPQPPPPALVQAPKLTSSRFFPDTAGRFSPALRSPSRTRLNRHKYREKTPAVESAICYTLSDYLSRFFSVARKPNFSLLSILLEPLSDVLLKWTMTPAGDMQRCRFPEVLRVYRHRALLFVLLALVAGFFHASWKAAAVCLTFSLFWVFGVGAAMCCSKSLKWISNLLTGFFGVLLVSTHPLLVPIRESLPFPESVHIFVSSGLLLVLPQTDQWVLPTHTRLLCHLASTLVYVFFSVASSPSPASPPSVFPSFLAPLVDSTVFPFSLFATSASLFSPVVLGAVFWWSFHLLFFCADVFLSELFALACMQEAEEASNFMLEQLFKCWSPGGINVVALTDRHRQCTWISRDASRVFQRTFLTKDTLTQHGEDPHRPIESRLENGGGDASVVSRDCSPFPSYSSVESTPHASVFSDVSPSFRMTTTIAGAPRQGTGSPRSVEESEAPTVGDTASAKRDSPSSVGEGKASWTGLSPSSLFSFGACTEALRGARRLLFRSQEALMSRGFFKPLSRGVARQEKREKSLSALARPEEKEDAALIGLPLDSWVHPEDRAVFARAFQRADKLFEEENEVPSAEASPAGSRRRLTFECSNRMARGRDDFGDAQDDDGRCIVRVLCPQAREAAHLPERPVREASGGHGCAFDEASAFSPCFVSDAVSPSSSSPSSSSRASQVVSSLCKDEELRCLSDSDYTYYEVLVTPCRYPWSSSRIRLTRYNVSFYNIDERVRLQKQLESLVLAMSETLGIAAWAFDTHAIHTAEKRTQQRERAISKRTGGELGCYGDFAGEREGVDRFGVSLRSAKNATSSQGKGVAGTPGASPPNIQGASFEERSGQRSRTGVTGTRGKTAEGRGLFLAAPSFLHSKPESSCPETPCQLPSVSRPSGGITPYLSSSSSFCSAASPSRAGAPCIPGYGSPSRYSYIFTEQAYKKMTGREIRSGEQTRLFHADSALWARHRSRQQREMETTGRLSRNGLSPLFEGSTVEEERTSDQAQRARGDSRGDRQPRDEERRTLGVGWTEATGRKRSGDESEREAEEERVDEEQRADEEEIEEEDEADEERERRRREEEDGVGEKEERLHDDDYEAALRGTWLQYFMEPGRDQLVEALRKLFDERRPFKLELPYERADGQVRWFKVAGYASSSDSSLFWGLIQDATTDRTQLNEQERRRALLTLLTECQFDGWGVVDIRELGQIVEASPSLNSLLNREVKGLHYSIVIPPAVVPQLEADGFCIDHAVVLFGGACIHEKASRDSQARDPTDRQPSGNPAGPRDNGDRERHACQGACPCVQQLNKSKVMALTAVADPSDPSIAVFGLRDLHVTFQEAVANRAVQPPVVWPPSSSQLPPGASLPSSPPESVWRHSSPESLYPALTLDARDPDSEQGAEAREARRAKNENREDREQDAQRAREGGRREDRDQVQTEQGKGRDRENLGHAKKEATHRVGLGREEISEEKTGLMTSEILELTKKLEQERDTRRAESASARERVEARTCSFSSADEGEDAQIVERGTDEKEPENCLQIDAKMRPKDVSLSAVCPGSEGRGTAEEGDHAEALFTRRDKAPVPDPTQGKKEFSFHDNDASVPSSYTRSSPSSATKKNAEPDELRELNRRSSSPSSSLQYLASLSSAAEVVSSPMLTRTAALRRISSLSFSASSSFSSCSPEKQSARTLRSRGGALSCVEASRRVCLSASVDGRREDGGAKPGPESQRGASRTRDRDSLSVFSLPPLAFCRRDAASLLLGVQVSRCSTPAEAEPRATKERGDLTETGRLRGGAESSRGGDACGNSRGGRQQQRSSGEEKTSSIKDETGGRENVQERRRIGGGDPVETETLEGLHALAAALEEDSAFQSQRVRCTGALEVGSEDMGRMSRVYGQRCADPSDRRKAQDCFFPQEKIRMQEPRCSSGKSTVSRGGADACEALVATFASPKEKQNPFLSPSDAAGGDSRFDLRPTLSAGCNSEKPAPRPRGTPQVYSHRKRTSGGGDAELSREKKSQGLEAAVPENAGETNEESRGFSPPVKRLLVERRQYHKLVHPAACGSADGMDTGSSPPESLL
ncbi:hypothetical protein TGARI_278030 [Toxoplasma gondii ARI]|uniref:Transmembrane protein n=1 Tax=Toxoplasma gondii ARI TaxID=1074872 RepID=A0A139XP09_TOXGO|nr:hypothetical protein TGARI_278030 [Toxoplasma gondii ARI]